MKNKIISLLLMSNMAIGAPGKIEHIESIRPKIKYDNTITDLYSANDPHRLVFPVTETGEIDHEKMMQIIEERYKLKLKSVPACIPPPEKEIDIMGYILLGILGFGFIFSFACIIFKKQNK